VRTWTPEEAPVLYLKPLVTTDVFVFLRGGGVLKGKLTATAEDHLELRCEVEKRGGEKLEVERFINRQAIQWVEPSRGQRVD
jgi:hypothetical protein